MIDIGIQKKDRKLIADSLCRMLADSYLLLMKTQGFYWNIRGENAHNLQLLFHENSIDLMGGIHSIAQRIRALDFYVPMTFNDFLQLSSLKEDHHHLHESLDIIRRLIIDNEFLVRRSQEVYEIATASNDPVTRHMMQERMRIHSESAWKMRIHID